MEMVFTQLPMNPSVSDSHSSRHSCFPYIPVSTLFQSAPGTSIGHTHLCVRYTPSDSRKHIACVSRCFSDIPSLSSTTIHTKKYPPHGEARPVKISFPSSYIPGHNSWFLRLKEEKYQNDLKTPLHSESPPRLLHSTLQPQHKMAEGYKRNSSRSTGTDARRGHTHQSVHSLHRTPALQAVRSSCSC